MENAVTNEFLTELSKYFMEFLENDFKSSRPPTRRIRAEELHDASLTLDLKNHPTMSQRVFTLLQQNVKDYTFPLIKKEHPFYDELTTLLRNKDMLDGKELYAYFATIKHNQNHYPLFYIRFDIEETPEKHLELSFDPVLFINKKAISYLCEQHKKETNKQWAPTIPPRHVFLEQFDENGELFTYLQTIIDTLCAYLDLAPIDLSDPSEQRVQNKQMEVANSAYFCLFDKSDETILNDYEEFLNLLQKGHNNEAFQSFSTLMHEFLYENPISVESEMEEKQEQTKLSDRFSYYSPIALNNEQQLALRAIDHPNAKRIVIEGPPGTGKSHTITAIIYDALLRGKSILMVSDKEEALDVVEDKINSALDRIKIDDFVQNPVLRLGKKNNNYQKIFSQANFSKIKTRHSAYKKEQDRIEIEIDTILTKIKQDIEQELAYSQKVTLQEVQELIHYEATYEQKWHPVFEQQEMESKQAFTEGLSCFWTHTHGLNALLRTLKDDHFFFIDKKESVPSVIKRVQKAITTLSNIMEENKRLAFPLLLSSSIQQEKITVLEEVLRRYEELKMPVFGYLFTSKKTKELEHIIKTNFLLSSFESLKKQQFALQSELYFYKYCEQEANDLSVFFLLNQGTIEQTITKLMQLEQHLQKVLPVFDQLPQSLHKMEITLDHFSSLCENIVTTSQREELAALTEYLLQYDDIIELTTKMIAGEYHHDRHRLEERLVLKMTHILDERVIEFREKYRNDASEIRNCFRQKKQISKEHLRKLIRAFPCFIVGIRELGEFVPLEPNLFDLVIIDEGSQVSIAQAFPAILRAKKVIVLGDSKQYSNVKSHNASKEINHQLFQRVKNTISSNKAENFNVQNSILEFIKNISNYHTILKKHFRGYMELIDYSNDTFYDRSLEVMKIRTKPITEVISFQEVTPIADTKKNVNEAEASFILQHLIHLKNNGSTASVGIITPFRDQQKWLSKCLFDHPDYPYFKEHFKLKVMTFDSCQGEERDLILYSMVEKKEEETLKYIFPVDLANTEDTLKAQRLNVGFSRVKEKAIFVISKDLSKFTGEVGKALRHFHKQLAKKEHHLTMQQTDHQSPMEKKMLQWILQTPFYQTFHAEIEIIPQFNIGHYIKQIDKTATIPNYRTDFLFIFRNKIVILEYDGFEYHFKQHEQVNEQTYEYLYTERDIERQKTIESYGYPFIRMNKFVVKQDPIAFLETQFSKHFRQDMLPKDPLNADFVELYEKIENKELKTCSKCGEMKDLQAFFDAKLKTLYGRICQTCKNG